LNLFLKKHVFHILEISKRSWSRHACCCRVQHILIYRHNRSMNATSYL